MNHEICVLLSIVMLASCLSLVMSSEVDHYITLTMLSLSPVTEKVPIGLSTGKDSSVTFSYAFTTVNITSPPSKGWIMHAAIDNGRLAKIKGDSKFYIDADKPSGNITIVVAGEIAGRSNLRFHIEQWYSEETKASMIEELKNYKTFSDFSFPVYIVMIERPIDKMFNAAIFFLVVTANIGMGTQVDLKIVKAVLRRPLAPAIGLFSQFFFMPLIAFFTALALKAEPGISLGLFALGCSPGGLISNMFAYLLKGNVSLSITMTLVSTLASLALTPAWLFSLGPFLYGDAEVKIPFLNIIISLLLIVLPTILGLYIQQRHKKLAAFVIKSTKYVTIFFIVFILTFGLYANWYVFFLVDGKVMIASAALPYIGFLLGGFAAFVGRQRGGEIITIAIETGIQNSAVPIVLLRLSLKGPEQATGVVVPMVSSTLTPIPLILALVAKEVVSCVVRRDEQELMALKEKDTTLISNEVFREEPPLTFIENLYLPDISKFAEHLLESTV